MSRTCEHCQFFRPILAGAIGHCRRYPPTKSGPTCDVQHVWIYKKYWCGEFRRPVGRPKKEKEGE